MHVHKSSNIKLVAVGDGTIGKTSLLITHTAGIYPVGNVPTVSDHLTATHMIGGNPYEVSIWDTAGQEDYDRIRPLCYPQTDIFLICFSVVSPISFETVDSLWLPEISHYCPSSTPFFLVGLKIDLRTDEETIKGLKEKGMKVITRKEGEEKAKKMKARGYLECSSFTNDGVKNVFDTAIQSVVSFSSHKDGGCLVM